MTEPILPDLDLELEPERYELAGAGDWLPATDRRGFLQALGGGLVVLCLARVADAQRPAGESGGGRRRGGDVPRRIDAWLHVAPDGTVTASTGKVEVGQNARTSLTQAVADELRVAPGSVRIVMGDTARVPFDAGTFGSRTTPSMVPQIRRAAAAARERLAQTAAKRWEVEPASVVVRDGAVHHEASGRRLTLGELAADTPLVDAIDEDTPVAAVDDWTVAGRSLPKVDGRDFVTGRHAYTSDITRPGMLRGKVLRPPTYGATLARLDDAEARAIAGAIVVRDGEFAGVAAPDEPTASRALAALKAEWTAPDGPPPSDATMFEGFRAALEAAKRSGADPGRGDAGSIDDGMAAGAATVEATFTIAPIAHAPLEPRAAVAEWSDGSLTVWTGTQRPFGVRDELMRAFGLPEAKVRVIVPDTGSGYGGKHTGEAAIEAARLARAAGAPVKLVWTRAEEFAWAYSRPAGLIEVRAAADGDGRLTAWEFRNVNSGASGIAVPYEVPNRRVAFHQAPTPLRQGSYRALAATANHFARESVIDELARALGIDPLAFRLKNLPDTRMRAVLGAAADRFGWGKAKPPGDRGVGLACGAEKGGYVATCAEVEVDKADGSVRIVRAVTAFECGAVINPTHLENQVVGSVVMGLGGALFEALELRGGAIRNGRFSRYRVPRFGDVPALEVVLVDRKDLPSAGAGETPIVAIAPAVANAIADAVGIRLRGLPLVPDGLDLRSRPSGA